MKILLLFLATLAPFLLNIGTARADYFVWREALSGMTITFPDTWQVVTNQKTDDVLTIMAPAGRGHAMCHVRIRDDQRYMIYPPRYSDDIQKIDFSLDFWDQYLKQYKDAQILNVQNTAGLGRGFAGYAVATYESAVPGPYMARKALMFASLYNGDLFILECSSHRDAFADWKGLFLSIAGSVDFKPAHHQVMTGHYHNFLADPGIVFKGIEGENYVVY